MKVLRKKYVFMIIMLIMFVTISNMKNNTLASSNLNHINRQKFNIGVVISDYNNDYITLIRKDLEDIEKENVGKVKFIFFNSKANQAQQNADIDLLIKNEIDLLIVNLTDTKISTVEDVIDRVKEKQIPLIILSQLQPSAIDVVKSYDKAIVVSSELEQSGILQGKILVNLWNSNKEVIDKNSDNKLQYIILKGESNSESTIKRTEFALSTINNAEIQIEELASVNCNWDRELAKNTIESLFLKYAGHIEAIIANSDSMAIGAVEGLRKYGYNKGNPSKSIPVVGIDGIPEAQDLVQKGFMTGTVFLDSHAQAEALYYFSLNLINNRSPIENTNYRFDDTKITIRFPYKELIK